MTRTISRRRILRIIDGNRGRPLPPPKFSGAMPDLYFFVYAFSYHHNKIFNTTTYLQSEPLFILILPENDYCHVDLTGLPLKHGQPDYFGPTQAV